MTAAKRRPLVIEQDEEGWAEWAVEAINYFMGTVKGSKLLDFLHEVSEAEKSIAEESL